MIKPHAVKHEHAPAHHSEARDRLDAKLIRELGDSIMLALHDPAVVEIMLNPDGLLWEDRQGYGMQVIGAMTANRAENLIGTIASALNVPATKDSPIVEGELPIDGSRFEGILPPVVERPIFAIRKKALQIFTFDDYVRDRIMTEEQRDILLDHIMRRNNILVVGQTGSGKTTFCNAVLHAISIAYPECRMGVLEDTRELQCPLKNKFELRTSDNVDMTMLLKASLRLNPSSLTVGEVRDKAALALLKAWNTGHNGGVSTTHANGVRSALPRIEHLVQEAGVTPIPVVIAAAFNCIVSIQPTARGRRIEAIGTVKGVGADGYIIDYIGNELDIEEL